MGKDPDVGSTVAA